MTVEQLGYAKMDLRNPALAVMAEAITGSENRYSGIPTMRREMAAYGLPAPVFENRRNEFVVIFYNSPAGENDGKTVIGEKANETVVEISDETNIWEKSGINRTAPEETLLEFCRTPRTRKEIAAYFGIQTVYYVMKRYVHPLLESGKLAMTNPDRPNSKSQKYYAVEKGR